MAEVTTDRRCFHCADIIHEHETFAWVWLSLAGAYVALCTDCYRRWTIEEEARRA